MEKNPENFPILIYETSFDSIYHFQYFEYLKRKIDNRRAGSLLESLKSLYMYRHSCYRNKTDVRLSYLILILRWPPVASFTDMDLL